MSALNSEPAYKQSKTKWKGTRSKILLESITVSLYFFHGYRTSIEKNQISDDYLLLQKSYRSLQELKERLEDKESEIKHNLTDAQKEADQNSIKLKEAHKHIENLEKKCVKYELGMSELNNDLNTLHSEYDFLSLRTKVVGEIADVLVQMKLINYWDFAFEGIVCVNGSIKRTYNSNTHSVLSDIGNDHSDYHLSTIQSSYFSIIIYFLYINIWFYFHGFYGFWKQKTEKIFLILYFFIFQVKTITDGQMYELIGNKIVFISSNFFFF